MIITQQYSSIANDYSITMEQTTSNDNNYNNNNESSAFERRAARRNERDSIRPYRLGVSLVPDGL